MAWNEEAKVEGYFGQEEEAKVCFILRISLQLVYGIWTMKNTKKWVKPE